MREKPIQHHIESLAALLLFGVFAVCVLAVLLTGADAYRRLTQRDQAAYDRRTCVQYIVTRVRQSDVLGGIAVEPFGTGNALVLRDGSGYLTRVYSHGGYIMELFSEEEAELAPEDGEKIMESLGMDFSLAQDVLTVTVREGERDSRVFLSLRSGEGAEE